MGKWNYGVLLDAGSSGTRAYVYRWLKGDKARNKASKQELESLPAVETKKHWAKKVRPGLSTFADKPEGVRDGYLPDLLQFALQHIPDDEVEKTPIFLLATAGMRQVPYQQQAALMDEACAVIREQTKFYMPDCRENVRVITGEEEGLFGWLASNYLLGSFNEPDKHEHGAGHHTYGFLEMGGASAQMAFVPNATESEKHSNDLTLVRMRKVNGESVEYPVFTASWLGYGSTAARRRYVESLLEKSSRLAEVSDPCLPKGLKLTATGESYTADPNSGTKEPHLVGTGNFTECVRKTNPVLNDDAPCPDKPCVMGKHVPAVDLDLNHFVGISRFYDIPHEIPGIFKEDEAYNDEDYQERMSKFCALPWSTIQKDIANGSLGKLKEKTAIEGCFQASWYLNMLHDGLHLPQADPHELASKLNTTKGNVEHLSSPTGLVDPFQIMDKIHEKEVSWTLGKAVLLASAQTPTAHGNATHAQSVGYGPNTGESWKSMLSDIFSPPMEEAEDWHDTLFSDSHRRIPGFLIFLLIMFVVFYLALGRQRVSNIYRKILRKSGSPTSKQARKFAGKGLFGFKRSEQSYERVMEEGEADQFELADVSSSDEETHSDSSGPSHRGRASGWATPQISVGMDPNPLSPPSYFDTLPAASASSSLPLATVRSGLMSRSESKEKLTRSESKESLRSKSDKREKFRPGPLGAFSSLTPSMGLHGFSRSGSPTRMKSPMMSPLKENVD